MNELFIDGRWLSGEGPELDSRDPATGARIWEGRTASAAQLDSAVAAARAAFQTWQDVPFDERARAIERFAERVHDKRESLARAISRETGKPTWEALTEVASVAAKVRVSIEAYRARTSTTERQLADASSVVRHRPHGVLGVLGPYNFPCHLPNGHIVPALLAGNTVVFKPSEHTPWCGIEMVKLWESVGIPKGTLNLVVGARPSGVAMVTHRGLDGLLFTGSAAGGHAIHRAFGGRPDSILALEMGGNNPLVVEEVTDVDAAAFIILQSAYVSAGQRCTCARRLFVPEGTFGARLTQRVVAALENLRVGSFEDAEPPFMGPLISEDAVVALLQTQARLEKLGGRVLVDMRHLEPGTGLVSPGLIDMTSVETTPDEEHFGPLLQLYRYHDFDEALDRANATRFGLAAGLVSEHPGRWKAFLRRVRAGVVSWNRPLTGASSAAPFGGIGASGNHRPSAYYAADYCAYPVASLERPTVALPDTLPPGMVL